MRVVLGGGTADCVGRGILAFCGTREHAFKVMYAKDFKKNKGGVEAPLLPGLRTSPSPVVIDMNPRKPWSLRLKEKGKRKHSE